MSVVDTLLAGWHSPTTLAAVAVGSAIWSLVILVLIGVLMAVPPIIAQLNGAGRRHEIGGSFRQALWLALAMGLGLMVLVRNAGWMFDLRSEEHTSELQSLMRISYAVFCLKKKHNKQDKITNHPL